jgi:hypothetical protein
MAQCEPVGCPRYNHGGRCKSYKGDNIRKVALVGSKNINIGLGKVFGAFAQMAGLPYAYKSFRNTEDAVVWLENESI